MEWELLVGQIELIVEKIRFLWRNLMIFDIERWSFFCVRFGRYVLFNYVNIKEYLIVLWNSMFRVKLINGRSLRIIIRILFYLYLYQNVKKYNLQIF